MSKRLLLGKRQRGATLIESIIVFPVLLIIGMSMVQWALVYHVKTTLGYATFLAARTGSVTHADVDKMRAAFGRGLLPLFVDEQDIDDLARVFNEDLVEELESYSYLCVISPTGEAFDVWEENDVALPGIPNIRIDRLPETSRNDIDIRDANILEIEASYGYELKVPFAKVLFVAVLGEIMDIYSEREKQWVEDGRIPMTMRSSVHMQSEARSEFVNGNFCD